MLKIREVCDLMLALFSSEVRFYEGYGVPTRFVGHLLANIIPPQADRVAVRARLGLPVDRQVVALVPGSYGDEVGKLSVLLLNTVQRLLVEQPGLHLVLLRASATRREWVEQTLQDRELLPPTLSGGASHGASAAYDAVPITSGTMTLRALLYEWPMMVTYWVAGLTYRTLRHLVRNPYASLPSLLAGRLLVPELIQGTITPQALAATSSSSLDDGPQQAEFSDAIHRVLHQDTLAQTAEVVL